MKRHLILLGLLATLLSAPGWSAPPPGFTIGELNSHIRPGVSRAELRKRLGPPRLVLPDGSWVFDRCTAARGETVVAQGHLVVQFEGRRIVRLELVDVPSLRDLQASSKRWVWARPAAAPLTASE